MATDIGFGIDTSVLSGPDQVLDDTFNEINTVDILNEDVYKGTFSPSAPVIMVDDAGPFPLMFWEQPSVSFDLHDWLNASLGPADISACARRIEAIYTQDLRFTSLQAKVDLTTGDPGGTLTARVQGLASGQRLDMSLIVGTDGILVQKATS